MMSVVPLLITPALAAGAEPYVLLVDDHEPSLQRLDELLRNSGHRCMVARSGAEALACCDNGRPRVVVTDLSMPNLDGRGLARWLQSRCPSVPIILMTGQAFDPGSLDELKRTFTATCCQKPIDIEHSSSGCSIASCPRPPNPSRMQAALDHPACRTLVCFSPVRSRPGAAGRSAAWLARLPWEQEVTSSNLVAPNRREFPTTEISPLRLALAPGAP